MPISEKAQRAWKAGTAVVTAWTGFYGLFYIDYGPHEHCFSDLQRWYRRKLDEMLGINTQAAKQIARQRSHKNTDDNLKEEGSGSFSISIREGGDSNR
mmetsp:Transcript_42244/g.89840  ORF Transcript_42244/g.89840 Transcript_42244/m.89840 type:complete len:98 (-) Transcript_42244:35-328(-)|eukprot:CAMPEP_0172555018 /NCGR_PEP_ID=MMETSP1067-20121228/57609_1 /TAXON_ID=265564 ORGANISM="Thalassiosira punctigera, Strain Tpunct2005C2" /NCGR_SAMPLE_ID=MMETSP1067 /ASSEMBLY_ACC=CAM_ASM_000444 /LENGTH=97 /DNA_ID=CAMNT_0013343515 /DNA_START=122 /DNA_END=418 /DNA_ORIENTATION=+